MKKILYLSQLFPHPPDSGGKIKTLNTVLTLAKKYKVQAIFISEERPSPADIKVLTDAGIKVKVFYSSAILASVKDDLSGLFKNFLRGIPHYVFQYTHRPAGDFIQKTIGKFNPDIIHIDHLNMAQYLPKIKKQTWILEHHNVETYLYWTRFIHTNKPTRKLYLLMEMALTYIFEKRTLPKFDYIFAISQPEKLRLKKIFGANKVAVQPLVFPPAPVKKSPHKNPIILFVGTLGWPPNEDAVGYFIKRIFPLVEARIPRVEFHVVGRSHPPFEKTLAKQKNIIFHGYQPKLMPFLAQTDVFVLPFRMGGGVRLKALTALSAGVPLVSTPLGVEGLTLSQKKHYLSAHSDQKFADAVIAVIGSRKVANKLRINSLQYLRKHHHLNQNDKFLKEYQSIIN